MLEIKYKLNDEIFIIKTSESINNDNIKINLNYNEDFLKVIIEPKATIEILDASYHLVHKYNNSDNVLANGYQSWTMTKELNINSFDKGLQLVPKVLDKKFAFSSYGDYNLYHYPLKKGIIHSWNHTYIENINHEVLFIGSLNENECFTNIIHNKYNNSIKLVKDICGFHLNKSFRLFDICFIKGNKNACHQKYFELLGLKPKTKQSIHGYTSWYNHYQNINEEIILNNLESIASSNIKYDIYQIDDGFETYVGDFLNIDTKKFPSGLKPIVEKIHNYNMKAGIWLAPFVCETDSNIFKEHPDWLLKDQNGNLIKAGHNWSHSYALDFENDQVKTYVKEILKYYLDMGFDFFKLDFIYAVGLKVKSNKTRAMLFREVCTFLRNNLGNKLILGCGAPLVSEIGLFDFSRIGCDVGFDYDNSPMMRLFHNERVSTKNAILNTIYRSPLNNYYFGNDPDVYFLRDGLKLTNKQEYDLFKINHLFSDFLFTSDNISNYDENTLKHYEEIINIEPHNITYYTKNDKIYISYLDQANKESNLIFDIKKGLFI